MSLKDFFNQMEDTCIPDGRASFHWSLKGIGFGGVEFYIKDGKLMCMNECMGKETIKRILNTLVDQCELEDK